MESKTAQAEDIKEDSSSVTSAERAEADGANSFEPPQAQNGILRRAAATDSAIAPYLPSPLPLTSALLSCSALERGGGELVVQSSER